MLAIARIGVVKIMLNSEQHDARAAGERCADQINRKKQHRTECPAHQHPYAEQHYIVPEHMPVFFVRFPIARFITGGVRPHRWLWLRNFPLNDMAHEANTAFEPGEARIENHIYKAGKRSYRDAALTSIHALLRVGHCR